MEGVDDWAKGIRCIALISSRSLLRHVGERASLTRYRACGGPLCCPLYRPQGCPGAFSRGIGRVTLLGMDDPEWKMRMIKVSFRYDDKPANPKALTHHPCRHFLRPLTLFSNPPSQPLTGETFKEDAWNMFRHLVQLNKGQDKSIHYKRCMFGVRALVLAWERLQAKGLVSNTSLEQLFDLLGTISTS